MIRTIKFRGYAPCRRPQGVLPGAASGGLNLGYSLYIAGSAFHLVIHLWIFSSCAGPKHHGSEGRIGPAARSPECQTSLSEPTRN